MFAQILLTVALARCQPTMALVIHDRYRRRPAVWLSSLARRNRRDGVSTISTIAVSFKMLARSEAWWVDTYVHN
jgi:hypothetical protein